MSVVTEKNSRERERRKTFRILYKIGVSVWMPLFFRGEYVILNTDSFN